MIVFLWVLPFVRATDVTGNQNFPPNPSDGYLDVYGTANVLTGASISSIYVYSAGTLNFHTGANATYIDAYLNSNVNLYGGTVTYAVSVYQGSNVIVYGDHFTVGSNTLYPPQTIPISQALTSYDAEGGVLFSGPISCASGAFVSLVASGGPQPGNDPPVANAGPDLTVFTKDIASTVIDGLATDPDEGDSLQYRWLEGSVEFTLWEDAGSNGEAPLALGTILPQYLEIGTHILTLEVTDGIDTVSEDMVLTIEIAPLTIDIKPGSYPNSINLGSMGVVPVAILSSSDFDATTIPADTVFLAGSGVAVRGKGNKLMAHEEDVNEDGFIDLVVQVETQNFDPGTIQDGLAYLKVHESSDPGSPVLYEGCDEIIIVPPEG
jgi:hypothetical protein